MEGTKSLLQQSPRVLREKIIDLTLYCYKYIDHEKE